METRVKKALENHKKKYNCCQSVVCAYADKLGVDEEILFRASEGFGLGFGGQKEVCGAVSAMALVAGLKNSSGNVEKAITKGETYALVNNMCALFKQQNTSIICRELLGEPGLPKLRTCDGCIEDACHILDKILF